MDDDDLTRLGPWQRDLVERALGKVAAGATRLVVVATSGSGRTTAIASVLLRLQRPMLIVAPAALQQQWLELLRPWCRAAHVHRSSADFAGRRELDAIDIVAPALVREGSAVTAQLADYEWVVLGAGMPGAVAARLADARRLIVEDQGLTPPHGDGPAGSTGTATLFMARPVVVRKP